MLPAVHVLFVRVIEDYMHYILSESVLIGVGLSYEQPLRLVQTKVLWILSNNIIP